MPSHVNLETKDLSKFSPRAIRCLKWWLNNQDNCPFYDAPANIRYSHKGSDQIYCRRFCDSIFYKCKKDELCWTETYSVKYFASTVRAIIKLKEAEHG